MPYRLPKSAFFVLTLGLWAGLQASAAASELARPAKSESRAPNIVLIMADDLGYGELGCYGQKWIRTPHIDQLAADGVRFTQFYAGSPICASSRCVLMTGKHSGHAAIRDNGRPAKTPEYNRLKTEYGWEFPGQNPLPAEEVTIAEALQQQGYATAAIGKWGLGHFGATGDPNRQGFDLFYGFNCQWHAHNHYPRFLWRNTEKVTLPGNDRSATGETYSQDKFMETAMGFVRDHQDQPFFLYLPVAIPHLSIQVPDQSLAEYDGLIPEEDYEHRGYLPHPKPRAGYAAMVSHLDHGVGQLVKLIDSLGLAENTLIIFTSDNGPTYNRLGGSDSEFFDSTGGLRGRKGSLYEGGIRVPFVARWEGQISPGSDSSLPCAAWDLLKTFCDLAGKSPPVDADGVSLVPELTGRGVQLEQEALVWEFPGYGGQQAIRVGDWKAVRQKIARGNRRFELYNLINDPGETTDLAAEYPERVRRAEQLLEQGRTDSAQFPIYSTRR